MKLSRRQKIALGVATLWPCVYFPLVIVVILSMAVAGASGSSGELPAIAYVIGLLHVLSALLLVALLAIYILHAARNDKLDQNGRLLWALLFLLGSFIAMAVYFYVYVRPTIDVDQDHTERLRRLRRGGHPA